MTEDNQIVFFVGAYGPKPQVQYGYPDRAALIEKAARALFEQWSPRAEWDEASEAWRADHREDAEAVLVAVGLLPEEGAS